MDTNQAGISDSTEGNEVNEGVSLERELLFASFAVFCKTPPRWIHLTGRNQLDTPTDPDF